MFHHILVADRPHTNTYNGYSVSSQCKKRKERERERELFEKIKVKRACAKKGVCNCKNQTCNITAIWDSSSSSVLTLSLSLSLSIHLLFNY